MIRPPSIIPHALVADDQVEVLEALRLLLKGEGILVHGVTSPQGVLQALQSQHFDILLMDLNYARDTTSGHEGLDLLDHIQALDATLPVIVMTGWGSVELAVETMRRGVRDFVQKPWDNERLIQILRTHIEQGQIHRKGLRLEAEERALRDEMKDATDIHALLKRVAEHLHHGLQIESVVAFTMGARDHSFWAAAQVGLPSELIGRMRFEADSKILPHLTDLVELRQLDLPEAEIRKFEQAHTSLIVPIQFKNELIGFLSLGKKISNEGYDAGDVKFLNLITKEIGSGIDSLRLRGQEREYDEAKEIQQGLLPKEILQIPSHEISGAWQPASAVGGDYFDVLKFSDSKIALCIADVVGKGIPAALLMSNLQAAVKAFASEYIQPRDLCSKVNQVICSNIAANKFITFFYCLYDSEIRQVRYANAGHNPPILLKSGGKHMRLQEGGAVLGIFREWDFEQNSIAFGSGDRIILYTDGVTEVTNSADEEFGEDRLVELLEKNKHLSAKELHTIVMREIADFGGGELQDDATLLVMSHD